MISQDGGLRAWLVILGVSVLLFGYVNSWGVFQAYYEENTLKEYSPSTIAWIGSVQYAFVLLPALFSGRLFDLGIFKLPFLAASIVVVVCTILVGQCTQYWHFFLCQGVGIGIGCGMWFRRRRGLAMGITALGSSVGGTIFPIAAQNLIPKVGLPWTMRILGFILLFALVIPNLTLERRLPPRNVSGGLFNLAVFKNPAFSTYAVAVITGFLGLYTVLTYIDLSALAIGVSQDMAFYLVAIANASSGLGRIMAGLMADKVGAINFIAPTTLLAGALSFAWPFAKTEYALIVIAVLYGFTCGAFVSGLLLPVFELGDVADAGRRTGMIMTVGAAGALCGIPISGAINKATGGFEVVGYYAGSITVVSVIFMLITRHLVLGRLWGKF
ncbi:MFS general substrate transporter [Gymnopus androsaceus JB14]|uniref:MFS general substrate transporter n=1 Tax=Gymnopus androsaceus JB14 TaxID=1447944 RepID=A0A6A4I9N9_9AGAR|nr:MFS general substrate transporter [Gymnopus androsaceus JB14]